MVTVMAVAGSALRVMKYAYSSKWKFLWRSRTMVTVMEGNGSSSTGQEIYLGQ